MKATFKPLSLAIAVSAATAGYVGTVNAQKHQHWPATLAWAIWRLFLITRLEKIGLPVYR